MSPERIEELAREACSSNPIGKDGDYIMEPAELAKFAALIRAEALEEAARECNAARDAVWPYHEPAVLNAACNVCENLADRIRALKR